MKELKQYEHHNIGDVVMADNGEDGEPILVLGYITHIEDTGSYCYFSVDWTASTDGDTGNLGEMHDYEKASIDIYRRIYDDWLEDKYDPSQRYNEETY